MKCSRLVVAILVVMCSSATLLFLPEHTVATTRFVGGMGPGNYTSIQAAIDNASVGDTIYVYSGTYYENVVVDRPLTLIGEDRETTIINGGGIADVVYITADWVNVSRFSVTNSGLSSGDAGVDLYSVDSCSIANNNVSGNRIGISLLYTNRSYIIENIATSNSLYGISLKYSNMNKVTGNRASNNDDGINLGRGAMWNDVTGNNASSNNQFGIVLYYSDENNVTGNNASSNFNTGISLCSSVFNDIIGNVFSSQGTYGIYISYDSNYNTISQNHIALNNLRGLSIIQSSFNRIYHNRFVDNADQASVFMGSNQWDDGYPSGGNYWSDYTGLDQFSGPNQDQPGRDGIGDTPYDIPGDSNSDRYPLMDYMPIPPDLVAKSLVSEPPSPVLSGTSVMLNATVANDGGQAASDFAVTLFEDSNHDRFIQTGEEIYTESILTLDPGEETSINHSYVAGEEGIHDVCVWADPPPGSIEELQEDNNILCMNLEVFSPTEPRPPSELNARLAGDESRDVLLSWDLSPDDGNPSNPVARYEIFRGISYERSGSSYPLYDSVPNGTSFYIDKGAGEGDQSNYFYYVCAVNIANNSSCSPNQAGKFTRPLSKGRNLISIPLIQSNESIVEVLQTVKFDKVWTYDSHSGKWLWYMTFKPYKGDLRSMNETKGFWVSVTEESNFTIAGIVPFSTVISLEKGWNLVSFPSFANYTVGELRTDVYAIRIEGFDLIEEPYHLRLLFDLDTFQAGYGYWVRVESDVSWTVTN